MDNQEQMVPGVNTDQPPANPDVDKLPSYEDVCPSGLTDNEPPPYIDTPPPHISLLLPLSPTSSDTTVPSPVPQNSPDPSWSSQENDLDTNTPTLVPQNSPDPYWRSQENGLTANDYNAGRYEEAGRTFDQLEQGDPICCMLGIVSCTFICTVVLLIVIIFAIAS